MQLGQDIHLKLHDNYNMSGTIVVSNPRKIFSYVHNTLLGDFILEEERMEAEGHSACAYYIKYFSNFRSRW